MTALFLILWSPVFVAEGRGEAYFGGLDEIDEFGYKALFLKKFAQFIEWPETSDVNDLSKPFIVGIIGKEDEKSNLEEVYTTEMIKKKKVKILLIMKESQISGCNMVYILKPVTWNILTILSAVKDKPILTVSDARGMVQKGIHIRVFMKREKIKFEMNQGAFKESLLVADYRLYRQASKIVNRDDRGN